MKGLAIGFLLLTPLLAAYAQEKPLKPYQLYEKAEAIYWDGKYAEALSLLDECLRLSPGYMEAYPLRAGAREQLGDHAGALTDYSIYIEKFPMNPEVLMSRGVLRYKIGFYEQARQDLRSVLALPGDGETTTIFYRQNMSVKDLTAMTTNIQQHNAFVYNYLGLIEFKLNNNKGALGLYDTAIRIEPREADFYVNRGLAREAENHPDALTDYEMALRLNPNHVLARHNAEALRARSAPESAEGRLTRTIEADSTMLYPYLERAQQRFEAGYFKGAHEDYSQALEMDPGNTEVWYARALTREKLKDFEGAFSDYTRAIDLKENYAKAWLGRGNVLLKLERFDDAVEDYSVALLYYPDYGPVFHNRAIAYYKLKKPTEACTDLLKAESLGMKVDSKMKTKVCEN